MIFCLELTRDLNHFTGGSSHARANVMKLRRVDHLEAMIAHSFESGDDVVDGRTHNFSAAFVTGIIQVQVFTHEAIGHTGKAIQRILDSVAEQLATEQVIINRNSKGEFQRAAINNQAAVPEI